VVLTPAVCKKAPKTPHLVLQAIDLHYQWKRAKTEDQLDAHIRSSRLCLPLRSLLEEVHGRFMSYHLAKFVQFKVGIYFTKTESCSEGGIPWFSEHGQW
jgi:hypothetical protein